MYVLAPQIEGKKSEDVMKNLAHFEDFIDANLFGHLWKE